MANASVSSTRFPVNSPRRGRSRRRRRPALGLWWLWLATVLIQLVLLLGLLSAPPKAAAARGDRAGPGGSAATQAYLTGTTVLLLLLRSPEGSPFPWRRRWRVRRITRRRQWADLTVEDLLVLLPPGVRTLAQLVDALTRSQMAKLLAALPLLYPILTELEVEAIIDHYCPTEGEIPFGAVVVILCLNRLTAPRPLSGLADWAAKTALEELTGVAPAKLNDDRLGRALEALYPHLEEIWSEIVGRALVRYRIDLSLVFYDLTTLHFQGAYAGNDRITLGYTRSYRGKKQRKLALNVAGREKFPFLYQLLDGNVTDVATVQRNMERLLQVLQQRGWPVDTVLVVGDRAMLSAEIVLAYHRAQLKYLGALKVMGAKEETLLRGVTEKELRAQRLDDDHYGVKRPYTFAVKGQGSATDTALVTLSLSLRRQQRAQRAAQIRARGATLQTIRQEQLNQRKYKRRTYVEDQLRKQVQQQPGGLFLQVAVAGEDGALTLTWRLDRVALRQAMRLDGKFLLVTNDEALSGVEMVQRYGEKDKVEKSFRTLKGPLRLRPVFLHKEERIASLVMVTMLSLLVYSILETKCRRGGLAVTGEKVLKGFAALVLFSTRFVDGSVQVRVEELTSFQRAVLQVVGPVTWPTRPDGTPMAPPALAGSRELVGEQLLLPRAA
jgi:transposase